MSRFKRIGGLSRLSDRAGGGIGVPLHIIWSQFATSDTGGGVALPPILSPGDLIVVFSRNVPGTGYTIIEHAVASTVNLYASYRVAVGNETTVPQTGGAIEVVIYRGAAGIGGVIKYESATARTEATSLRPVLMGSVDTSLLLSGSYQYNTVAEIAGLAKFGTGSSQQGLVAGSTGQFGTAVRVAALGSNHLFRSPTSAPVVSITLEVLSK